jgi:hypothetical protein
MSVSENEGGNAACVFIIVLASFVVQNNTELVYLNEELYLLIVTKIS